MTKSMRRALCVLLLLVVAALAHGEGDGPRSRARQLQKKKEAVAAQLKQAPAQPLFKAVVPAGVASQPEPSPQPQQPLAKCDRNDVQWLAWRDENIQKLLTLGQWKVSSDKFDPDETPSDGAEEYLNILNVMKRSTDMANELDECAKGGFFPSEVIMGDFTNFTNFVNANRNYDFNSDLKHQFGHQPDDHEYLRRIEPQVTLPCLLRSPTFLELISSPTTYYQAWQLIERNNTPGVTVVAGCPTSEKKWLPLIYRSKFLTTPDNAETFGRFFVFVPGQDDKDYDRWIQFGVWLPEDEAQRAADYGDPISNVSVVSIAKSENPRADNRFDALADWWRVARDGQFGLELKFRRQTPPYESDNCIRCHKVLPIGIHPAAVYHFNQDKKLTLFANARQLDRIKPEPLPNNPSPIDVVAALQSYIFKNYRRAPVYETDRDDTIASPFNYGPPLGKEPRTVDSVRACAAPYRLDDVSLCRVSQSMRCASCHNGKPSEPSDHPGERLRLNVGMLNFPLATEKRTLPASNGALPNLIQAHISTGVMPPDNRLPRVNLTESERDALYACLSQDYFSPKTEANAVASGKFVDWLKNQEPAAAVTGQSTGAGAIQCDKVGVMPTPTVTRRK